MKPHSMRPGPCTLYLKRQTSRWLEPSDRFRRISAVYLLAFEQFRHDAAIGYLHDLSSGFQPQAQVVDCKP